jgi:hypothetical protein
MRPDQKGRHNLIARLIDDQHIDQVAGQVPATLAAYRTYTTLPGADILRVGRDLNQLASQLVGAGLLNEAAQVGEAAAAIVRG